MKTYNLQLKRISNVSVFFSGLLYIFVVILAAVSAESAESSELNYFVHLIFFVSEGLIFSQIATIIILFIINTVRNRNSFILANIFISITYGFYSIHSFFWIIKERIVDSSFEKILEDIVLNSIFGVILALSIWICFVTTVEAFAKFRFIFKR